MSQHTVLVGGGRMGEALLGGLLATGWATPDQIAVVEVSAARRDELASRFPGVAVTERVVGPHDNAIIAVKPGDVAAAVVAVREAGVQRILSVAAGVTTATLQASAGESVAVVRSMPNTAAIVGKGASAISPGPTAGAGDTEWAASVLRAVGTVEVLPEYLLDAVTGLTGSGPAYLFLVAEALIDAGVLVGLPRSSSEALVRQLFVGAAALLDGPASPEQLRAQVTSPGGTTAAGLRALEEAAVRAAFLDAVSRATERSRQLGS